MISKLGQPLQIVYLFKVAFTYMITVSQVTNSKEYGGPEWMCDLPKLTHKAEPGPCPPCSLHPLFHFYFTSISPPNTLLKYFSI